VIVNQALIDEIVSNVLARLQPASVRPVVPPVKMVAPASPKPAMVAAVNAPTAVVATPTSTLQPTALATAPAESKSNVVEILSPVITADMLDVMVNAGQGLRIGRTSILTPSARDWLNSKRTTWSRLDRHSSQQAAVGGQRVRWQIILQTVTPTVKALHDGIRRLADGWKIELVGQPLEAATLATNLVNTAECDGVVVFTEQAELIACRANRNDRVRAAVVHGPKQWEQVMRTLSANVVCINPVGKTFIELRNLLRDCSSNKPRPPAGW
jgi:hypothetical protein